METSINQQGWDWMIMADGFPGFIDCGYFLRNYDACKLDLDENLRRFSEMPELEGMTLHWALRWTPVTSIHQPVPSPRSALIAVSYGSAFESHQAWRDQAKSGSRFASVRLPSNSLPIDEE